MNIEDLIKELKQGVLWESLGLNPEALAYITAGDNAFQEDKYSQAIEYFTKAIELDPKNYYPLSKRGKCYQMTQQYDTALVDIFKSNELDNKFENNQSITECYLFKKQFSKAVQYFDIGLEQLESSKAIDSEEMGWINYGTTKARALNNQAICYFNLQKHDKAIDCTTKGIKANPNYPNNYFLRGLLHFSLGNKSQARDDLQNVARHGDTQANAVLAQMGL